MSFQRNLQAVLKMPGYKASKNLRSGDISLAYVAAMMVEGTL